MVSGNTESLSYVGNDGTCDHSWLTMLLGKRPLIVLVSLANNRSHTVRDVCLICVFSSGSICVCSSAICYVSSLQNHCISTLIILN